MNKKGAVAVPQIVNENALITRVADRLREIKRQLNRLSVEQGEVIQDLQATIDALRGSIPEGDLYQALYWGLADGELGALVRVDHIQTMLGFDQYNPNNRAPKPKPWSTGFACPDCGAALWVHNRTELTTLTERGPTITNCLHCGDQRRTGQLREKMTEP
jgi:hypothetical protein